MSQKSSKDFLLDIGLEILHKESVKWISEIKLWKIELSLFQKLIDNYGPALDQVTQKKEIDHFQNLITYYNGELLDEFKQQIRRHENTLAKEFAIKGKVNEASYRENHKEIALRITAFETEFKAYKKELFSFIEKVI
jgi:hypothetical protein